MCSHTSQHRRMRGRALGRRGQRPLHAVVNRLEPPRPRPDRRNANRRSASPRACTIAASSGSRPSLQPTSRLSGSTVALPIAWGSRCRWSTSDTLAPDRVADHKPTPCARRSPGFACRSFDQHPGLAAQITGCTNRAGRTRPHRAAARDSRVGAARGCRPRRPAEPVVAHGPRRRPDRRLPAPGV